VDERFDVTLLGAGIAGTVLAAILARHGLKVVVLEEGDHPKFAIGESTIPEFTLRGPGRGRPPR
jgi:FADH2 O2-dependent halogenase